MGGKATLHTYTVQSNLLIQMSLGSFWLDTTSLGVFAAFTAIIIISAVVVIVVVLFCVYIGYIGIYTRLLLKLHSNPFVSHFSWIQICIQSPTHSIPPRTQRSHILMLRHFELLHSLESAPEFELLCNLCSTFPENRMNYNHPARFPPTPPHFRPPAPKHAIIYNHFNDRFIGFGNERFIRMIPGIDSRRLQI